MVYQPEPDRERFAENHAREQRVNYYCQPKTSSITEMFKSASECVEDTFGKKSFQESIKHYSFVSKIFIYAAYGIWNFFVSVTRFFQNALYQRDARILTKYCEELKKCVATNNVINIQLAQEIIDLKKEKQVDDSVFVTKRSFEEQKALIKNLRGWFNKKTDSVNDRFTTIDEVFEDFTTRIEALEVAGNSKSPWLETKHFEEIRKDWDIKLKNLFGQLEEFNNTFVSVNEQIQALDSELKNFINGKKGDPFVKAQIQNSINEKMKAIQEILGGFKGYIENLRNEYTQQCLLYTKTCKEISVELTDTKLHYNQLRSFMLGEFGSDKVSTLPTITVKKPVNTSNQQKEEK